ncbi:SMP-30/gluconolactonase/LRE family protein [Brevundimonas diminuta]
MKSFSASVAISRVLMRMAKLRGLHVRPRPIPPSGLTMASSTGRAASGKGRGILYRFDPDGTWHVADTGFDLPNGLEWSKDGNTFYFTDSHKGEIYAYDFDPATGEIGNRRLFFGMDPRDGKPDGLTLDPDGHLLSVLFDGSAIVRIGPSGSLERLIPLPVPRPTSCAFAGDGGALFITTARAGLTENQLSCAPQSGVLFEIDYDSKAQRSRISE